MIKLSRVWAMPNTNTFSIKPIKELISRYKKEDEFSIDPFANNSTVAIVTNDSRQNDDATPFYNSKHNEDAYDFLKMFDDNSVDTVYFDPPYSFYQSKIKYKTSTHLTISKSNKGYWSKIKKEIARVLKPNGICISCGWNSGGIGKCNDMEILEILIVNHGGGRNDTIVTVDKKII